MDMVHGVLARWYMETDPWYMESGTWRAWDMASRTHINSTDQHKDLERERQFPSEVCVT